MAAARTMSWTPAPGSWTPAPGWPAPPSGWTPPSDWSPPPDWPAPPTGWDFWPGRAVARRRVRLLGAATAVLALAFIVVYLVALTSQPPPTYVAWWLVGVVLVLVAVSVVTAVTGRAMPWMVIAAVLAVGCALLGLLSVGPALVPAAVTAALAIHAGQDTG